MSEELYDEDTDIGDYFGEDEPIVNVINPRGLKPCPFCGQQPKEVMWREFGKKPREYFLYHCPNEECPSYFTKPGSMTAADWNTRPIEDALRARIAELEAERKRLFEDKSRLMDCYFEFETIAPDGELKISVLDLYNELTDTRARAERAEAMVTRLIEAGNILADGLDTYWQECYPQALGFWNSLVAGWKERQ